MFFYKCISYQLILQLWWPFRLFKGQNLYLCQFCRSHQCVFSTFVAFTAFFSNLRTSSSSFICAAFALNCLSACKNLHIISAIWGPWSIPDPDPPPPGCWPGSHWARSRGELEMDSAVLQGFLFGLSGYEMKMFFVREGWRVYRVIQFRWGNLSSVKCKTGKTQLLKTHHTPSAQVFDGNFRFRFSIERQD